MTTELEHHGIKGMQWGVRRTDAELARIAGQKQAKLNYRVEKAKTKAEEAKTRALVADAKRKEAEAAKINRESKALVKKDKVAANRQERRLVKNEKALERKAKIAKQEEVRKESLKENKQTDTKLRYDDYKKMSDEELRNVVGRWNQEEQFKKFNPKPPSTLSQIVKTVGGTAAVLKMVNDATGGMDKIVKNISPEQAKQATTVINMLSAFDKKKK